MDDVYIYLVRHGQTDWNVDHRMQGHIDIPLNACGRQQAQLLAKQLNHIQFHGVYSSDLCRASETAQLATQQEPILLSGFREQHLGVYEGKDSLTFSRLNLTLEQLLKTGMEPLELATQRFMQTLIDLIANLNQTVSYKPKTILVVSHGMIIKSFCKSIGLTLTKINNCEIIKLMWSSTRKNPAFKLLT
jgi:broad specificity phosphatase PhoE